jgi:tetratricopeptide (TPR) repeat protein
MKDVLVFIGFFATILLVALLIPALLVAGYLRARRKGYRAPSAALVPLVGSAAGILAAYKLIGKLPPRSLAVPFVLFWGAVLGAALVMGFLISVMPKRNPRVFGRRRPRFPFVTIGWALIAVGVLVCVYSFISWAIGKVSSSVATNSLGVLGVAIAFGGYLVFLGRRVSAAKSLEEVAQTDPRQPVLYLRPFNQESELFVSGPKSQYGQYAKGFQRFIMDVPDLRENALDDDSNVGIRFEDYFTDALEARIGPFCALGNPEDYTLPEGAVRTYATDTDWKDHLSRLAKRSSCIVAEPAGSDNLRWEFEYLRGEGLHQKLFILTRPPSAGNTATDAFYGLVALLKGVRPVTWRSFSETLGALGYRLPANPGPGAVVTFDDSGEGVIVARGANSPLDYVEPVRTRLIETRGYPAERLNPPTKPELDTPKLDSQAAPAISAPPARRPWSKTQAWGLAAIFGVLYSALAFRPAIPVLRDIGVAGGADERKALELYNRQEYSKALPYFERAAAAGNTGAMTQLGFMNQKGQGGFPPNDIEAARWYRKAADARDPQAMVDLAVFYLQGRGGLSKDYQRAVDLGRKATEANNSKGMLLLALMYENGMGLPKDLVAARGLYQKSADLGDSYAKAQLERLDKGSKPQRRE